ncbi:MAG TPA: Gfo/Idh/MocA family oxidoreductase [Clostridiaceae bacterium]|nr:Gfo/Idh/MocA family oxidoreductase [Clostridiaceae bacterium]
MKKITAVLLGAGSRGADAYGRYALEHPYEIQFIAVAEPNRGRRELFRKQHGICEDMCFESWEELLEQPKLADAIVICTQDRMHFEPAIASLEKGYHVLLEKPMSYDARECVIMGDYAKKYNRIFLICHVLRYTQFFSTIKKLLEEGRIGDLVSVQHNENIAYWHFAHSYVRGNWRNSQETSPMILAKCCHDMDILLWLAGADCDYISSFGSLTHFKSENAPEGAPQRCLDGCPAAFKCLYYAPKQYLTDKIDWPTSVISVDKSYEARLKALKEGPYGRCVYHCDNDVADHQVVSIHFTNDVTAAFSVSAFTRDCHRTIKLMGTKGEIRGSDGKNELEILDFATGATETIRFKDSKYGHGGGDFGIMQNFVKLVREEDTESGLTSAEVSVQSHLMALAAEKSRVKNRVINMKEFEEEIRKTI